MNQLSKALTLSPSLIFSSIFGQENPEVVILGAMKKETQPIIKVLHTEKI